ncbi:hypothetical protein ARSQ2_00802 [Arsenophonus endosymbiont of Bemisia tabaci Q2]|nr:hypothetical protein ARSQ2_00802 [Arsenophonus endosymbiont of Bemisia tabaci Q2]
MQLIVGDTIRGPMSLTYTAHGLIPTGKSLTPVLELVMVIGFMLPEHWVIVLQVLRFYNHSWFSMM